MEGVIGAIELNGIVRSDSPLLSIFVRDLASPESGKPARNVGETDGALCRLRRLNKDWWRKWMIIAVFVPCVVQEVSVAPVRADGSMKSPLTRLLADSASQQLLQMAQANAGDLIFITAGPRENTASTTPILLHTHADTLITTLVHTNKCIIRKTYLNKFNETF